MNRVGADQLAVLYAVFNRLSEVNADVNPRHRVLISGLRKTGVCAKHRSRVCAIAPRRGAWYYTP